MTEFLIKLLIKDSKNVKSTHVRRKYAYLSGITGIAANTLLFSAKLAAGIISGSISIIADAFNNLSDVGSSAVSLIGFKLAGMQADDEHPFGHGRIEYLAGLVISILIMLMGVEIARSTIEKIFRPSSLEPGLISFVVLSVSIVIKLRLGFFNKKLGDRIDSAAIRAVAADSMSDVIATGAVLAGGVIFLRTGISLDAYIGFGVAVLVFVNGIKTAKESFTPLLGTTPDNALVREIVDTVLEYPGIIGIHDLIVHNYGVGVIIVSLHAELPSSMSFAEAHEITDELEICLNEKFKCHATIHMDPIDVNDKKTNELRERVLKIVSIVDPALTIHDFRVTTGTNTNTIIFDVVIPFKFRLSDKEVTERLTEGIEALDIRYRVKITADRVYI